MFDLNINDDEGLEYFIDGQFYLMEVKYEFVDYDCIMFVCLNKEYFVSCYQIIDIYVI